MAEYRFDSSKGEQPPVLYPGDPPVDQSAEVARLQAELDAANAKLAAGRTEAQQTVDALA